MEYKCTLMRAGEKERERERFSATSMKKIEGMPKLLEGKKEEIEDEKKLG